MSSILNKVLRHIEQKRKPKSPPRPWIVVPPTNEPFKPQTGFEALKRMTDEISAKYAQYDKDARDYEEYTRHMDKVIQRRKGVTEDNFREFAEREGFDFDD